MHERLQIGVISHLLADLLRHSSRLLAASLLHLGNLGHTKAATIERNRRLGAFAAGVGSFLLTGKRLAALGDPHGLERPEHRIGLAASTRDRLAQEGWCLLDGVNLTKCWHVSLRDRCSQRRSCDLSLLLNDWCGDWRQFICHRYLCLPLIGWDIHHRIRLARHQRVAGTGKHAVNFAADTGPALSLALIQSVDHVIHLLITGHHPALNPHYRLAGCLRLRPAHAANHTTKRTTKSALVQRGGEYARHRVAGFISPLLHRLVNRILGGAALYRLRYTLGCKAAHRRTCPSCANLASSAANTSKGAAKVTTGEICGHRLGI
ncbi:hypothetical protein CF128_19340 [Aeromonas veronii]|nr:hypothetical protein CF128_19340 [Aeromonas veronii]